MPDITMCYGKDCPLKDKCYRATAAPNPYRQAYWCNSPVDKDGKCEYYWPIKQVQGENNDRT